MDIEPSLRRLRPTADRTLLRGVHLDTQLEQRILERIQLDDDTTKAETGKYLNPIWMMVLTAIVMLGLVTVGFLTFRQSVHRTITTIETTAMEISPAVAAIGALAIKDARRTLGTHVTNGRTYSFAN